MTTKDEALKLALEALEQIAAYRPLTFAECSDAEAVMRIAENAIPYLQEALAEQPAQHLVGSARCPRCWEPITPPAIKPLVGLTDEQIDALAIDKDGLPNSHLEFARAIEAKLLEKNNA